MAGGLPILEGYRYSQRISFHSNPIIHSCIHWCCSVIFSHSLFFFLVGGLEHLDFFPIILGMSSSQLTNTHIFFRGVGLNHQPVSVSEPVEIGMLWAEENRWAVDISGCWMMGVSGLPNIFRNRGLLAIMTLRYVGNDGASLIGLKPETWCLLNYQACHAVASSSLKAL